jgi:hypothetical protein
MNLKPELVAAALVAGALLSAPVVQADTNGYIARLQQDGVPMLSGTVPAVQAGMTACAMIRDAVSPQDVAGQVAGLWSGRNPRPSDRDSGTGRGVPGHA